MANLRWFQAELVNDIFNAFRANYRRVLAVSPTGSGKTVIMGHVAKSWQGAGVAIAHRQEPIGQISMALAKEGVEHELHASAPVRRVIRANHIKKTGRQWIRKGAAWHVGGVDTLVRLQDEPWMKEATIVLQDEAHHVLRENKWGKCWKKFPNAVGLGVTATPGRADGKGLGAHADGVFEIIVERAGMRQLIDEGYLTDYIVVAPDPSDLGIDDLEVSDTTKDFNSDGLRKWARNNPRIVGDVVSHYQRHALGKLGVTFCVDIESAGKVADAFNKAGVRAEVLSGKTPDLVRQQLLSRFARREFHQLVSVDILGEGFDLPAIEVVQFARPTESIPLFIQQCGRVLRLMLDDAYLDNWEAYTVEQRLQIIAASSKPKALIIDHVGNIFRLLPPDTDRTWSLDRRDKRARKLKGDAIPMRPCLNTQCLIPYPRDLLCCPTCGTYPPEPAARSGPDEVEGDLIILDAAALANLRSHVVDLEKKPFPPTSAGPAAVGAFWKHHGEKVRAQTELRDAIALWAGKWRGRPVRANYRRFYLTFGIDVLSACGLNAKEADQLKLRIMENIYAS